MKTSVRSVISKADGGHVDINVNGHGSHTGWIRMCAENEKETFKVEGVRRGGRK
jgi:hypothetical protein